MREKMCYIYKINLYIILTVRMYQVVHINLNFYHTAKSKSHEQQGWRERKTTS